MALTTLCGYYDGEAGTHCGAGPARMYVQGPRCVLHTPSALVGRPEAPETACPPLRCYCGKPACPAYGTFGRAGTPAGPTIVDARAVASGKRRAPLHEYRAAQDTTGRRALGEATG